MTVWNSPAAFIAHPTKANTHPFISDKRNTECIHPVLFQKSLKRRVSLFRNIS